jgi:hypothetical protein
VEGGAGVDRLHVVHDRTLEVAEAADVVRGILERAGRKSVLGLVGPHAEEVVAASGEVGRSPAALLGRLGEGEGDGDDVHATKEPAADRGRPGRAVETVGVLDRPKRAVAAASRGRRDGARVGCEEEIPLLGERVVGGEHHREDHAQEERLLAVHAKGAETAREAVQGHGRDDAPGRPAVAQTPVEGVDLLHAARPDDPKRHRVQKPEGAGPSEVEDEKEESEEGKPDGDGVDHAPQKGHTGVSGGALVRAVDQESGSPIRSIPNEL